MNNKLSAAMLDNEDILRKAFIKNNEIFMDNLPENVEIHAFSKKFEKKMARFITADNKFGGKMWLERSVRCISRLAVLVICFVMINFVSVKAFNFDIWQVIVTKTDEFIHINFTKNVSQKQDTESKRLKMTQIPKGYVEVQSDFSDNMSVQIFTSDRGTITFQETLISENADVNIYQGSTDKELVDGVEVSYVIREDTMTAFFSDETYYHILSIQGSDADKDFAKQIIKNLEEQ